MSITAKDFQCVLDVVKNWRRLSFWDRRVDGRLAIEDVGKAARYVQRYAVKPNEQQRGTIHGHRVEDWSRVRDASGARVPFDSRASLVDVLVLVD